jgi:hypothetical protein
MCCCLSIKMFLLLYFHVFIVLKHWDISVTTFVISVHYLSVTDVVLLVHQHVYSIVTSDQELPISTEEACKHLQPTMDLCVGGGGGQRRQERGWMYSRRKITESSWNVTVWREKYGKSKRAARLSTVCLSMYSLTENIYNSQLLRFFCRLNLTVSHRITQGKHCALSLSLCYRLAVSPFLPRVYF